MVIDVDRITRHIIWRPYLFTNNVGGRNRNQAGRGLSAMVERSIDIPSKTQTLSQSQSQVA